MIIRNATEKDLHDILEIYNDAILNSTSVYEYEVFSYSYMEKWFEEKMARNFPLFAIEENNKVWAFGSWGVFRSRPGYSHTVEHSVYVHPDKRGQGMGKAMLSHLIQEAVKRNIHVMIGGIDKENVASLSLHYQLGFEKCAELREVAWKFERWLDLIFVQRIISK
jgi:L-amino acid N-acyltransferase